MRIGTSQLTKACLPLLELVRESRKQAVAVGMDNVRRNVLYKGFVVNQYENTVDELVESLSPVFQKQIEEMATRLEEMDGNKTYQEQAQTFTHLIFNPRDWTREIIDRTLPVLALNMGRAGVTQLLLLGVDIRKSIIFNRKQTLIDLTR